MKEAKTASPRGLAWLEQVYFSSDLVAAINTVESLLPSEQRFHHYSVMKAGSGRQAFRTDVDVKDGIGYQDYSPPEEWEPHYSVQEVAFDPAPKTTFMYHPGEELLVPRTG